ncbi:MAG: carboxypeptidase-like regulatory domain-containing protein [Nitrospirae bacterium]|nr:carboxypeptidase-like regulatory domain-containing protein [Nitrospirota bacterium]
MRYPDRLRFGFVLFLLLGSLCPLSGQALEAPSSNQPPLNEKDFFSYKQKGRGSLTGQAFLSSPSGKSITQAGTPIHLIPITPYTRYWFDHNVRATSCGATEPPASAESASTPRTPANCAQEALTRLQTEKRLAPYLRTTRANPTGHFWFTKVPAGRYYLVSLIEGGSGTHQEERLSGLAWLVIELEAGEKATNLIVTDCKAGLC